MSTTLGAAYYRIGRYTEALAWLRDGLRFRPRFSTPGKANLAFTAMANQRLGRTEDARRELERLESIIKADRDIGFMIPSEEITLAEEAASVVRGLQAQPEVVISSRHFREVSVIRRNLSVRLVTLAAILVLVPAVGTRLSGQPAQARVVALRGGTVLTVTKGTIPNGTVVLRDGKIAAVGSNVSIPAGAEIIDTTGQFVSPGLIDAHSHIANDAINEGGTTVSSMTGMEDVIDATDINIYRDLAGGLTVANVLHGSANPIGGKNQVIKLRWGKTRAEEIVFEGAMPGIKFALGENPKDMPIGQATGPRRYPMTRMGVEFVIRDAFTRAKAYQKAWKDYEKNKASGTAIPPRRDLQLEPLVEILEGKRLVHAHSYRADEILMMIRLAEEMGFKIATFQHVLEGYMVAKEMAAHGAGGSTFSDWWAYKVEAADAIPHNAAIMTRKGVLVSINSDSAEHARRLNTEAAKTMKWGGMSEDEAFAMVTINPAKQLRIDSRVGSLETGKDADVVVWNHHPLSSYAIVERVYIDGTVYYDRKGEEGRLTALKKEKSSLAAAEGGTRPATTNPQENPRAGEQNRQGGPRADDDGSQPAGTAGSTAASGSAQAPQTARPAPAGGRGHRHHQCEDSPDHASDDRERHDRAARGEELRRSAPMSRYPRARRSLTRRAPTSIPASSTRARRSASTSQDRAASKTSARCWTSIPSFGRASPITPRATPSPSAARTASRRSPSCRAAAHSAAKSRS